jgi:integrative and conjugative element protein (TIGR02256 family)
VFKTFKEYTNREIDYEAGGILLGYVYKNYSEIIIATVPNKYDSFGSNFFIRSKIGAQPQINKAWHRSNGTVIYLGEWHTHLEINPKPTIIDKNMIINSLKKTKMEIDFLYLIIVGLNNTFWVGVQTEKDLIELRKVDNK